MPDRFTGGCACGAIRYRVSAEPRYMGNCHCRDCQQATGSAYFPGVGVEEAAFTLEKGDPAWFERTTDSGNTLARAFCQDCGSPVFLRNPARTKYRVLYAGSLDDPSWFEPARDIFVKSAQPWDVLHPDRPRHDETP